MSEVGKIANFNPEWPEVTVATPPEAFPELPALAGRLGVKPTTNSRGTMLVMKNGDSYDLFALVNAFLDRADAVLNSCG